MFRFVLRFLLMFSFVFANQSSHAGQSIQELAGKWALDRAASTFGPGDPGADLVEIEFSADEVTVRRFYAASPQASVWTLPLDGSAPPPPRRGSALIVDGQLVITHARAREVVTHAYNLSGNTLLVNRSIQSSDGDARSLKHTMVFKRVN